MASEIEIIFEKMSISSEGRRTQMKSEKLKILNNPIKLLKENKIFPHKQEPKGKISLSVFSDITETENSQMETNKQTLSKELDEVPNIVKEITPQDIDGSKAPVVRIVKNQSTLSPAQKLESKERKIENKKNKDLQLSNSIANKKQPSETPKKIPIVSTKSSRLREKKVPTDLDNSYHKITDFFTQRRSERSMAKKTAVEKQIELQLKIVKGCEQGLKVEHFSEKGRGIVTTQSFAKGDFVIEYVGDLINLSTARKREKEYMDKSGTGSYMYYFQHKNKTYCIDATAESGKFGRLINHSRKGNLISRVLEIDFLPRLVLFAKCNIEPGTEILYDYGDRSKESLKNHPWLAL